MRFLNYKEKIMLMTLSLLLFGLLTITINYPTLDTINCLDFPKKLLFLTILTKLKKPDIILSENSIKILKHICFRESTFCKLIFLTDIT